MRRMWPKKPYICKKTNVAELAFCEVRAVESNARRTVLTKGHRAFEEAASSFFQEIPFTIESRIFTPQLLDAQLTLSALCQS